jgi:hypothetical protein
MPSDTRVRETIRSYLTITVTVAVTFASAKREIGRRQIFVPHKYKLISFWRDAVVFSGLTRTRAAGNRFVSTSLKADESPLTICHHGKNKFVNDGWFNLVHSADGEQKIHTYITVIVVVTVRLANFQWECLWWDIVVANENESSERDRGLGGRGWSWSNRSLSGSNRGRCLWGIGWSCSLDISWRSGRI